MLATEVLKDALSRNHDGFPEIATGLDPEQLAWQVQPGANSIGWLLWHTARVEDAQVAEAAGTEQVWLASADEGSFAERAALDLPKNSTGYGHTPEQVAAVKFSDPQLLSDYYAKVAETTTSYLASLTDKDLDRVVDQRWDPPVTLGVRFVSIVDDCAQHLGQAAYLKGLLQNGVTS
ncbi:mycothiol transferase [Haematomicrobium sanguinis]|uniref:mycothiol transferase n=1 Tax=Haematomicrobium sanguinis TaxID=479106 RepID=UPI00047A6724|nr:DUF664 domain-containing protein [Haematomicrobium sanguinis]